LIAVSAHRVWTGGGLLDQVGGRGLGLSREAAAVHAI
jgi:hypothetical protein